MNTENTQREKSETLLNQFSEVLNDTVTQEEVLEVIETFIAEFKKLQADCDNKMASNKGIIDTTVASLKIDIRDVLKALEVQRADLKSSKIAFASDLSSVNRVLKQLIQKVNDLPDPVDLTSTHEAINRLQGTIDRIALAQTGIAVRNVLENLQGRERFDAQAIQVEVSRGDFRTLEDVIRQLLEEFKKLRKGGYGAGGGSVGPVLPRHQLFTVSSSTTSVTLTSGVAAQGTAIWVRYQGQMLDYGVDYTVSGNKVTFVDYTFDDTTELSVTFWS